MKDRESAWAEADPESDDEEKNARNNAMKDAYSEDEEDLRGSEKAEEPTSMGPAVYQHRTAAETIKARLNIHQFSTELTKCVRLNITFPISSLKMMKATKPRHAGDQHLISCGAHTPVREESTRSHRGKPSRIYEPEIPAPET